MQAAKNLVPDSYLDIVSLELFWSMPLFSKVQKKKKIREMLNKQNPLSVRRLSIKCILRHLALYNFFLIHLPQPWCSQYHPHGVAGLLLFFCCCNPVLVQLHASIISFITVKYSKREMKWQARYCRVMQ